MSEMRRIETSEIVIDKRFSAPVFFEDGNSMFLAQGKSVKPYHVASIKRWSIPYLLTAGHEIQASDGENIALLAGFPTEAQAEPEEVETLEEIEDLEELD